MESDIKSNVKDGNNINIMGKGKQAMMLLYHQIYVSSQANEIMPPIKDWSDRKAILSQSHLFTNEYPSNPLSFIAAAVFIILKNSNNNENMKWKRKTLY